MMRAMVLEQPKAPLALRELPAPEPAAGQLLIRVQACAICRTDLHVIDGELPEPKLPLIPGHQVVGTVARLGEGAKGWSLGASVGISWLGWTCGSCRYCLAGQENLCDSARFTGYQLDGGSAEYALADHRFALALPADQDPSRLAPLLCGGAIGFRAYSLAQDAQRLGLYGFGAAAHILTQLARHQGREVYAFVRPGDQQAKRFALELGAKWAGDSAELPPEPLDAAIIFAPVGALVPAALAAVRKGGVVVLGGIHMSDIPSFPYSLLWGERVVRSVANLTREDASRFLALASQVPIRPELECFRLDQANQAIEALRAGRVKGSAVLNT